MDGQWIPCNTQNELERCQLRLKNCGIHSLGGFVYGWSFLKVGRIRPGPTGLEDQYPISLKGNVSNGNVKHSHAATQESTRSPAADRWPTPRCNPPAIFSTTVSNEIPKICIQKNPATQSLISFAVILPVNGSGGIRPM